MTMTMMTNQQDTLGLFIVSAIISTWLILELWHLFRRNGSNSDRDHSDRGCRSSGDGGGKAEIINRRNFWFQSTGKNHQIMDILGKIDEYKPPWWYWSHLGTIFAFGHDPQLKYEREIKTNSDGSRFAVDWYPRKPTSCLSSIYSENQPPLKICIFIPGLGLSSSNKFCQKFVQTCESNGFICAVVNHRGVGFPLYSENFWHPAHTDDVASVLRDIRNTHCCEAPHTESTCFHLGGQHFAKSLSSSSSYNIQASTSKSVQVFMVGYSAGTNVLMKTILKNEEFRHIIVAVLCVCVTYDYKKSRDNLESTWVGSFYSWLIALNQRQTIRNNKHVLTRSKSDDMLKKTSAQKMYKLSHFDAYASTHLFGYSNESDYHADLSNFGVNHITVPTLIIQPQDDPLHYKFIHDNVKADYFCCNENFIFYQPPYGNHFGFYEGDLYEAFSNTTSYTFPAKIGLAFFESVISTRCIDDYNHHEDDGNCHNSECWKVNYFPDRHLRKKNKGVNENVSSLTMNDNSKDNSNFFTCCFGDEEIMSSF